MRASGCGVGGTWVPGPGAGFLSRGGVWRGRRLGVPSRGAAPGHECELEGPGSGRGAQAGEDLKACPAYPHCKPLAPLPCP